MRPSRSLPHDVLAGGSRPLAAGEGADDIDSILLSAQMDFIGHRSTQVVAKLRHAVGLRSSAACVTLGNLLARGYPAPTSSSATFGPTPPSSPPADRDALVAAKLFVAGLEFELSKPTPGRTRSGSDGEGEDSAEGINCSLGRTLELVVGLTDCYRFAVLRPGEPADLAAILWARGAQVAAEALRHELINPSVCLSTHPSILLASRPVVSLSARPLPTAIVPHADNTGRAIQVHLLYLLALHAYPSDRVQAEQYWTEIIELASQYEGSVGTKLGDEIIARTHRRLHGSPDPDWKQSKQRKKVPKFRRNSSSSSGDALVDMWFERRSSTSAKRRGKAREADGTERGASSITLSPSRRPSSTKSTETIRPRSFLGSESHDAWNGGVHGASFEPNSAPTYPYSPPYTPISSPPLLSPQKADSFDLPTRSLPSPRLRSIASTPSLAHSPRLLHRTKSVASLSSLQPPDRLFATRVLNPAARRFAPDPVLLPVPALLTAARTATGFWHSLSALNPFKRARPSAIMTLRLALVRDEQCGMYWADSSDGEAEEVYEVVPPDDNPVPVASGSGITHHHLPAITAGTSSTHRRPRQPPRPTLSERRSFVDVTSAPSSTPLPSAAHTSESTYFPTTDPTLLELERKSRVGVKTTCARCGARGLNFPAVRTGETYCSRPCRMRSVG